MWVNRHAADKVLGLNDGTDADATARWVGRVAKSGCNSQGCLLLALSPHDAADGTLLSDISGLYSRT
jgi:hypothetical protein